MLSSNTIQEFQTVISQKDSIIQSLTDRLKNQQKQITLLLKQAEQQNIKLKEQVKKVPFSMYKQFITKTDENNKIINEYSKQTELIDQNNQDQVLKQNVKKKNTKINKYLVLKLNQLTGRNQPIFLSNNLQISTLQKLNINQEVQKLEADHKEQINTINQKNREQIKAVLNQNNQIQYKNKKSQFKITKQVEQTNFNFISQVPKIKPLLSKKQSIPLSIQCSKLSQQLSVLKQKLTEYNKVLQQSNNHEISILLNTSNIPEDQSLTCFDKSFIPNLTQQKWNQQKQQYIQYIQYLKKQLQNQRNYKFSFNEREKNQKNEHSLQKSQKPFRSGQSSIQAKKIARQEYSPVNQYLFKSPQVFSTSNKKNYDQQKDLQVFKQQNLQKYHKNNYQINKRQFNKHKGKVVYIRN